MTTRDSMRGTRTELVLVRIMVILNFVILVALVGPGRSHELDVLLRKAGVEDLIGRAIQLWILGSTIFATLLFGRILWTRRRATPGAPIAKIKVEGSLLLAWWLVVAAFIAYGFMLGMGG